MNILYTYYMIMSIDFINAQYLYMILEVIMITVKMINHMPLSTLIFL